MAASGGRVAAALANGEVKVLGANGVIRTEAFPRPANAVRIAGDTVVVQ